MNKLVLKGSAIYLNQQYKIKAKSLYYVMINLPFKCNYNCLKCCNRQRVSSRKELDLRAVKDFILRCKEEGAKVVVLAGEGEPTINRHFKDLIKFINDNELIPYVFTNGSRLNKSLALFLAQHNATLVINLDSLNKELYEKFTQVKESFDKVMKNINLIREIYGKMYDDKNKVSSLAINMVLNMENYHEVEAIQKFCEDDIVFVLNEPMSIGSAINFKMFKNITAKNIKIKTNPLGTLTKKSQCSYLKNGISLNSEGKILTCAYALETKDLYGDIDDDIRTIRKKVLKSVDDFYKKHGSSRCILRHLKYEKFI